MYKNWFKQKREEVFQDLFTLLSFKTISTDPLCKKEMDLCANWLVAFLKKINMDTELWQTGLHPTIFAEKIIDPSLPTLLFYGHYDVQPVEPLSEWKSQPFEPIIKEGNIYARGALDDKGQLFYFLSAIKSFFELQKNPKINIKVMIEGEEECGSVFTSKLLKTKEEKLKADLLFVVDSTMPKEGCPAITAGFRGMTSVNITCKASSVDMHSGIMGGIALNPNRALISAVAELWDEKGHVAIPGFYEGVQTLSLDEKKLYHLEVDQEKYRKAFGLNSFVFEEGYTLAESNTIRPTIEINGIGGGYQGEGVKTVIPSVCHVKISCRLVPGQDPERIADLVTDFIKSKIPSTMSIEVEKHVGGRAFRIDHTNPFVERVAKAIQSVYHKPCQFLLLGASIPIVPALAAASGAATATIGTGLDTDGMHAPNEHFATARFEEGFLMITALLEEFNK